MSAVAMARGKLIGVRFSDDEYERIERLIAHFERENRGVSFSAQMVIKAALARTEEELGLAVTKRKTIPDDRKSEPKPKRR